MKRVLAIVGLSFFLLVLNSGTALAKDDYSRPGFYLGGGGVYALENFKNTQGLQFDDMLGFNARLGYRLHSLLAIEIMGERIDQFDLKQPAGTNIGIETWVGTANAKLYPFEGAVQPYVLGGVGAMHAKTSGIPNSVDCTDIAYRFGGGLDLYATENWVINVEGSYLLPRESVQDVDYISLGGGVQFRF